MVDHNHRAQGTGQNEWYTPPNIVEAARTALGGAIDVDPASCEMAQRWIRAKRFFTIDDDGLKYEWHGRIWLNPPYSQPAIAEFVSKLVTERQAGRVEAAIMLTHGYTDTAWFHEAGSPADAICFTRGRIKFVDPAGKECAPTQGQAFFYYGNDVAAFVEHFAAIGLIKR